MIPCLVIGDSIAVGLHHAMPECQALVIGGATAEVLERRIAAHGIEDALVTIISLGSNEEPNDWEKMMAIRVKILGTVVWLLPPGRPHSRDLIIGIAGAFGDRVVDVLPPARAVPGDATNRHIHPSPEGDRRLAQRIRTAAR